MTVTLTTREREALECFVATCTAEYNADEWLALLAEVAGPERVKRFAQGLAEPS